MDVEPKVWEPSMNCRATTLSSAELAIGSLCQTLLPLSRKYRQPHKCFISSLLSIVSAILVQRNLSFTYQAHLPYPESLELSNNSEVDRKKSLAHLDRESIFPGHCQWAYLAVRRICMNQASHSHWYPSVSILCQTESEIVGQ